MFGKGTKDDKTHLCVEKVGKNEKRQICLGK